MGISICRKGKQVVGGFVGFLLVGGFLFDCGLGSLRARRHVG